MKVLHLISGGDKGGAKTHVFTLLSALTEEIDIKVICFMEGVFYNEIKDMPIPSMLIKQRYRNDLTIIKPLIDHIRKERYHIIHAHGARANFIAMFLRPFIKTPVITTVHSDYKLDFTENLYKKYFYTGLNTVALKSLEYYIAVSENFKEMLIARGFDGNNIYTVYNTIDFDKELRYDTKQAFLKRYHINADGKTIIGIIGRLDYVKGHDIFLNAVAQVLKKRNDVLFLIAGEGFEKNNLDKLAAKLGITDKVIFTGFIDDIFSFINTIDINMCSSRSESFPYMLLEGAMMKKPTISTAVGGIPDLIIDGKTGLLAAPGDVHSIAKKMLTLIENTKLGREYGENLYKYAKSNFSKESMKRRHIEIYNQVLERRKNENKLFDVALAGYYGYDNSGDDALLKAVITALRKEKPDIKILVLSKKPYEAIKEHNVFSINRWNLLLIQKYMKMCRVFIYGGGSLIQDITSTQSLILYTFLLWLAKHFGLKLMVYGNGIGPITKPRNIPMARNALNICDYISLRDPESLNDIKKLGVTNENIHISVDPVFTLEMDDTVKLDEVFMREGIDKHKKYFIVSLRDWPYNESRFVEKIAAAVNIIYAHYGALPLYLPMHPSDTVILKETIAKSNTPHVLLTRKYDVGTLMGIISIAEFAMCMRLHALIYAASVNVPVIGLQYDPKVKYFIEYIHADTYLDTSNLNENTLIDMINGIMTNLTQAKEKITAEATRLKMLSGEDAKQAIQLL